MSNKSALRLSTNVATPVVKPPSALTIPVALISPVVSNVYVGDVLFTPSLLFAMSQCNVSVVNAFVPWPIISLPVVKVVAPVPPYETANVPVWFERVK